MVKKKAQINLRRIDVGQKQVDQADMFRNLPLASLMNPNDLERRQPYQVEGVDGVVDVAVA